MSKELFTHVKDYLSILAFNRLAYPYRYLDKFAFLRFEFRHDYLSSKHGFFQNTYIQYNIYCNLSRFIGYRFLDIIFLNINYSSRKPKPLNIKWIVFAICMDF